MIFKKILPIIALTFVNTIGFSLLIPVLPSIVASFGYGTIMYGLLLSTYSICQFLAAPLLGTLSDHYGRKPLLIISHIGTLTSWFIFGLAYFIPTDVMIGPLSVAFLVILISRIVDGITGGNISVSNAYVADVTHNKERAKAYGLVGATFGIGFLIGPMLGAFSSSTSIWYLGVAILAACFSLIALIMLFFLKESNKNISKDMEIDLVAEIKASLSFVQKIKKYNKIPEISSLFKIRYMHSFIFTSYVSIIVIMLGQRFSLGTQQIGYVFVVIGLYSIINQGFIVPRATKQFGQRNSLIIGITTTSIGLILVGLVPSIWYFIGVSYVISLGISMSFISIKTLLNKYADDKAQGEVMGIDESLISLNSAYVPFLSGVIYHFFNVNLFFLLGLVGFYTVYKARKLVANS